MSNPDWPLILIIGIALGGIAMILVDAVTGYGRADEHRFENICVWQQGRVVDDLCISGKVVIGKKTDDSNFEAVK